MIHENPYICHLMKTNGLEFGRTQVYGCGTRVSTSTESKSSKGTFFIIVQRF